jgi:hypothetical protein
MRREQGPDPPGPQERVHSAGADAHAQRRTPRRHHCHRLRRGIPRTDRVRERQTALPVVRAAARGRHPAGRLAAHHLRREPSRAAVDRGDRRRLRGRVPPGAGHVRRLPARTPAWPGLQDNPQPGNQADPPVLERSGTSPPRHRLAAPQRRGSTCLEGAASPGPLRQPQTGAGAPGPLRDPHGGARLLRRPEPLGAGRPGPMGAVCRPVPSGLPRPGRHDQVRQATPISYTPTHPGTRPRFFHASSTPRQPAAPPLLPSLPRPNRSRQASCSPRPDRPCAAPRAPPIPNSAAVDGPASSTPPTRTEQGQTATCSARTKGPSGHGPASRSSATPARASKNSWRSLNGPSSPTPCPTPAR